jgi:diguanylate cyclase (GGDEF)-like protein/hemerythrin-like metal-binding protein/PAS domain S-box-containing protein
MLPLRNHNLRFLSARYVSRHLLLLVLLLIPLTASGNTPLQPVVHEKSRLVASTPPFIPNLYGRIAIGLLLVLVPSVIAIRFFRLSAALKRTIAESKQVNNALRESEALYRSTLNASPEGITVTDLEGRLRIVSPAAVAMFGYEHEDDLLGRRFTDLLVPEQHERANANIDLMFQGIYPGPTVYYALHAGGCEFDYEVNGEFILGSDGEPSGMVFIGRDVTERRLAKQALEDSNRLLETMSVTDPLTGLANRRCFDEVLNREHARHLRSGAELSLIMLDIDHFKAFNDSYGHVHGDECLQQVARSIANCTVRAADLAARYGGEEFACILPETGHSGAVAIAEKIRLAIMALAIPHNASSTADCVTASLGVVTIRCSADKPATEIIGLTDTMLYKAKSGGRNRVESDAPNIGCHYPPPDRGELALVNLVWQDDYCSGNPLIDSQHQKLFRISNELLDTILSQRPDSEVFALLMLLLGDVEQHFHDEEAILESLEYPDFLRHQEEHTRLYQKGLDLVQTLNNEPDTLSVGFIFTFVVYEVILQHMLGADRDYFSFMAPSE